MGYYKQFAIEELEDNPLLCPHCEKECDVTNEDGEINCNFCGMHIVEKGDKE